MNKQIEVYKNKWVSKEYLNKCGSCNRKELKEYSFPRCQDCRYYFCSNECWGEGNDDFCQDCLTGEGLSKFN